MGHPVLTDAELAAETAVVIAAYDEASALPEVLAGLSAKCRWAVVVDDGSSDATSEVASAAGAHVLRHPINLGQGAALQTGIDYATRLGASFIVTFDADGQHCADEILPMLRHLRETRSDIVLGSRFLGRTVGMPRSKGVALALARLFTRLTTGLKLSDTHNGFRALTLETAHKLRIRQNGMAHASEILDEIVDKRLRYTEFPVTIRYTPYSIAKGQRILNSMSIVKDQLFGRLAK